MTDVLERIQKRGTRPTVPPRDVSLVTGISGVSSDTSIPGNSDVEVSGYQGIKTNLEEVSESPEFDTKPRSLRLDTSILERVNDACRTHGVSLDVLVEALFLKSEANKKVWDAVVQEAKRRNTIRKEIANQRRVASQVKKIKKG